MAKFLLDIHHPNLQQLDHIYYEAFIIFYLQYYSYIIDGQKLIKITHAKHVILKKKQYNTFGNAMHIKIYDIILY